MPAHDTYMILTVCIVIAVIGITVDLVIFACFNFHKFVILELFAISSFREFSILKKKNWS